MFPSCGGGGGGCGGGGGSGGGGGRGETFGSPVLFLCQLFCHKLIPRVAQTCSIVHQLFLCLSSYLIDVTVLFTL